MKGVARSMHGRCEKCIHVSRKLERNRTIGKRGYTGKIVFYLTQTGREYVKSIHLAMDKNVQIVVAWVLTLSGNTG
jgi:hypothetical protein